MFPWRHRCLRETKGTTNLITIKDSIRILPSSLSKLAKDWKVSTQKDHFPHYFWNGGIRETLLYSGTIPPYSCFEPKINYKSDYKEMVAEFTNKPWSFLKVSENSIKGDCVALLQVLLRFFSTINEEFPMNPLNSVSAPSAAFRIWRTVQLPCIDNSIMDFSNSPWDTYLRQSYNGGIVDVYRPHLKTTGYYYDVNSLYPTAMCCPMPVGVPKTIDSSLYSESFFGFIEATVSSSPDEYIGHLPLNHISYFMDNLSNSTTANQIL